MKKYYLHEENKQTGPHDIDELKAKNIQKDTPVWYEGLSEWTPAVKVDELKDLFGEKTPPPFPGAKKEIPKSTPPTPVKKKSYAAIITLVIIGGVLLIGGLIVMNNPNAVPGIKLEINTPKPNVVTSRADGSIRFLFS